MSQNSRPTGITAGDQPIALGDDATWTHDTPLVTDQPLALALEDLIPDAHNEVVILDNSGGDIAVATHEAIAAQGVLDAHVTALGIDVSGYAYCTFEGGVTVFYPATHRLLVTPDV